MWTANQKSPTMTKSAPERKRGVPTPMQQTLILLKPDCVQRRLVGNVISRFELKGLRLAGIKLMHADRALAEKHYAIHKGKPFYESLLGFLTSGPTVGAWGA